MEIRAPIDLPFADSSHVDGYAVKVEDTRGASSENPTVLRLVGEVGLVEVPQTVLGKGETIKVRTGSYLPAGCDGVIPKEYVEVDGLTVRVSRPVNLGAEVVPRGSDIKNGSMVLGRGHRLRAQDLEVLKILGQMEVTVAGRPVIALLSVGSELTDRPDEVGRGKIMSTHDIVVSHMVEHAGGEARDLGIVPDDLHALTEAMRRGLRDASMVLTIGGSSVGEADLVADAVDRLGSPGVVVHGLKLQPGRVSGFGVVDGKPIFFLPGLIQSTVNAFVFLAYPLLRDLLGLPRARREGVLYAHMAEALEFRRWQDFKKVTWVRVREGDGGLVAEASRGESGMFSVLLRSTGYVLTPEQKQRIEKGEAVAVNFVPGVSALNTARS
jgi:molybdenum cofactor synthesis domain-containing protein